MMNLGIWNTRGLNALIKQKEAKDFCVKNKLGLIGLVENKLCCSDMYVDCKTKFFADWEHVHNLQYHPVGRIWILWKSEEFETTVLDLGAQYVHLQIEVRRLNISFFFTVIYAFNATEDMKTL